MTIIVHGFLGPLILTRGLASGSAPPAPTTLYVDARAVQLDAATSEADYLSVDPRAVQMAT